jgi:hypothetical protein
MDMNIEEDIIIVTTQFGLSIAQNLSEELKRLNLTSIITNNIINTDKLHIILFSFLFEKLPKNYILYQLEQINKSKHITDKLYDDIQHSLLTIDYSKENLSKYKQYRDNISYQMIPISNKVIEYSPEYAYDILFFGSMNERRKKILDYLLKHNIVVATTENMFGDNLYFHIKKAKIILNLHYYDNALLEIARLNEILQFNTLIISENSNLMKDNQDYYKDDVFFIENIDDDLDNINILIEQIYDCLKYFNLYKKKINKIRKNTIETIYNEFSENLKKNLISTGYINYKLLNIDISDDKIICFCDNYNIDNFKKINKIFDNIIDYFYIIKNKDRTMELYLNYKILCYNLLESDYQYIVFCNLDCVFPDNFISIYNTIIEFFLISSCDIYINKQKYIDCNNLTALDMYNNIAFFKYNKYENITFNSKFIIFSRNFAKIFIDNCENYDNNSNIDNYITTLIKDNDLITITNNISYF